MTESEREVGRKKEEKTRLAQSRTFTFLEISFYGNFLLWRFPFVDFFLPRSLKFSSKKQKNVSWGNFDGK